MTGLRILLAAMVAVLAIYTTLVIAEYGPNLAPVALANVAEVAWPGQFHLDFVCYLILSALWVAWRHRFSPAGIGLGLVASVGGILFFGAYLLVASFRANGDVRAILLGEQASTPGS